MDNKWSIGTYNNNQLRETSLDKIIIGKNLPPSSCPDTLPREAINIGTLDNIMVRVNVKDTTPIQSPSHLLHHTTHPPPPQKGCLGIGDPERNSLIIIPNHQSIYENSHSNFVPPHINGYSRLCELRSLCQLSMHTGQDTNPLKNGFSAIFHAKIILVKLILKL